MGTTLERFERVAADLTWRSITFVFDRYEPTSGDAYAAAVRRHGPRVAVAHLRGGLWRNGTLLYEDGKRAVSELWVSFPRTNVAVGEAAAEAFTRNGFGVTWSGKSDHALSVSLVDGEKV